MSAEVQGVEAVLEQRLAAYETAQAAYDTLIDGCHKITPEYLRQEAALEAARDAALCALPARNELARMLLRALAAQAEAGRDSGAEDGSSIPTDVVEIVTLIGPVDWSHTVAQDAAAHGLMVSESVRLTDRAFEQGGAAQAMQMLTRTGTDIVVSYVGTSPHSGRVAQALAGAWNYLYGQCAALAAAQPAPEQGEVSG